MQHPDSTCWTMIDAAADGRAKECNEFAERYGRIIRAYLAARWQGGALRSEIDDAMQEVFIECFKQGGLLAKADRDSPSGFRAFLFAAVRNVALRVESRRARKREQQPASEMGLDKIEQDDARLSAVFDKAWVKTVLRDAGRRQREFAKDKGEKAERRVELLRLRFEDALPIREIASQWQCDAAELHHEYAKARQEFKQALLDVVAFHHPGTDEQIERECVQLLTVFG